mgnify:CR=1 FL=1
MTITRRDLESGALPRPRPPWGALVGWLLSALAVTAVYWALARPDLRLWPGMLTHGDPARRAVALTFDDGPHPLWAPLIADTLERHGARGAFFLVAREALVYPEITARLARGGHEIGNHSYTHPYPNLAHLPPEGVQWEVAEANRLLAQFTGARVTLLRPPGGGMDDAVIHTAREQGMRLAWWSDNAADAASPPPEVTLWHLRHRPRPGSVVLLHQRRNTAVALERFFAEGGGAQYDCTTFSDLMKR